LNIEKKHSLNPNSKYPKQFSQIMILNEVSFEHFCFNQTDVQSPTTHSRDIVMQVTKNSLDIKTIVDLFHQLLYSPFFSEM